MRGQSLSGCYFSTCITAAHSNSYPRVACARHKDHSHRRNTGYGLLVSALVSPHGLWFCVGGRSPTRETVKTLRLFSTTAVHLCSHHSSNSVTHLHILSPKQQPTGPAGTKSPTFMGKIVTSCL